MDTVLVLGHSFVKRLDYFTKDRTPDWTVHDKKLEVKFIGKGGWMTHDVQRWTRNYGHSFLNRTAVVILAIGCNDITMRTTSNDIVTSMIRTIQEVKRHIGAPSIVVSQLMPRFLTKRGRCSSADYVAHYNTIIKVVNATLAEHDLSTSLFRLWTHDFVEDKTSFQPDGIHLTDRGNARFLRSLRKSVCCGSRKELAKVASFLMSRNLRISKIGRNCSRPLNWISVRSIPQHSFGHDFG